MCSIIGVRKQALYKREKYEIKDNSETNVIIEKIKCIKRKLPMTGGRKLKYMLARRNINVGRDRLFDMLKEHKLLVKRPRRFARTTQSNHWYKKHKNIYRNKLVDRPEEVFVSDITYIRVSDGFSYLSLVTDAYSRRIMGSRLSRDLSRDGTLAALSEAIENRIYDLPLLHHSDRGFQYCSNDYVETLRNNQISISMTESGSPYDNAIAERVNGILKTELGLDTVFEDHEQALKAVELAVKRYNKIRPHMSCDYLTPNQAHKTKKPISRLWKKKIYRKYQPPAELQEGGYKSYSDDGAGPLKGQSPEVGNNFYIAEINVFDSEYLNNNNENNNS